MNYDRTLQMRCEKAVHLIDGQSAKTVLIGPALHIRTWNDVSGYYVEGGLTHSEVDRAISILAMQARLGIV